MTNTTDIDQIVQDILSDMSLKEKAAIANLDQDKVPLLQYAFDIYISDKLGMDDEMSKDVMHRIWKVLQETHRIQSVKRGGQAWMGPAQGGGRMKISIFPMAPC